MLNINKLARYAQGILGTDSFRDIIAVMIWYKEDYRIIYKQFVTKHVLDFLFVLSCRFATL
jgi:hypothetical protein